MISSPLIMGVLNVTPDSFSDGGEYFAIDDAIARAEQMITEGADIVDVGGESSRPGADPVDVSVEIQRTYPVLKEISRCFPIQLSIDTTKFEVAEKAIEAGASIINDISGGADIRMGKLLKGNSVQMVLMHKKGSPKSMQEAPHYEGDVVLEIKTFLKQRIEVFTELGIERERLWVDPGIGFGKTLENNLEILNRLEEFSDLGCRVMIGTSRKSFLGQVMKDKSNNVDLRLPGTLASNLWAYTRGASVFRVHDVSAFRNALTTWQALSTKPT